MHKSWQFVQNGWVDHLIFSIFGLKCCEVRIFSGKIEHFKNLTGGVKDFTNSIPFQFTVQTGKDLFWIICFHRIFEPKIDTVGQSAY